MISRNCPICGTALAPEDYEGFRVWHCPQCQGHLLDLSRYESIKSLPEKTLAKLETEARDGFQGDNPEPVRCPRCHGPMQKRPLPVPGFENLHLDLCAACALVWLDGGELALAQLAHQATPGFRDAQEMKRRAVEREADPVRKAAFDEAVAKLPENPNPYAAGLDAAIREAFLQIAWGPRRPGRL